MKTYFKKAMTVGELIEELQKYSKDLPVVDYGFNEIERIFPHVWESDEYPYNKVDVLMIE